MDTLHVLTGTLKENEIKLLQQFTTDLQAACNADLTTWNEIIKYGETLRKILMQ